MNQEEFIKEIKKSKKYKDIAEEIIMAKVNEFFKKYNVGEDERFFMKEIKASLHKAHGSFRFNNKKIEVFLDKKDFLSMLDKNKSTRERLDIYSNIYEKIFEITGKPKSILDLGCGLNPCSIPLMKLNKELSYNAYDINESEMNFLNKFFEKFEINGKASILDLTKIENIEKLPETDLCLMFKLIDVLEEEKEGHKYSEEIIKILSRKCKFIVVSFATRTISGKKMMFASRGWIERMLFRIGLKFEELVFDSEIFYVISSN
jgi:uncharacterized protein YlzI (FlbEa/FlbD family)